MQYCTDEPVNLANVPPMLEQLIWAPAWTRIYTYHVYPDQKKREDIRNFAWALLGASQALRTVRYEWGRQSLCTCWLLPSREVREDCVSLVEDHDDVTWAQVR
ncbi:hypothetical protein DICSQDRAFT_155830 [Dichomitus squalens LYAD-421 SS1]|uniref:Uncharacterized protein n=1 Tax=Dichomitus squalens (strain LYAD-421) TaxID=732165 RepID=R7SZ94_DICSQ|nr:uncharacterized protein DICSQDRAFT_155830 [Dichomitus squalens LYAD-421 SS1]EJF60282.1 hypothetical protein DICSQDRAFT_155830 [Dichomitus squalens LYAD-421 SS1]